MKDEQILHHGKELGQIIDDLNELLDSKKASDIQSNNGYLVLKLDKLCDDNIEIVFQE
jgi:hypothetical protein